MVQAILDVTLSQGIDPASAAFVAGGGAAGLNCVAIGRRLGCRTVYVPETGAALAAAGALISDLTSHHQAMRHTTSESFDFDGVNELLEQLEGRCRDFQKSTGSQAEFVAIDWTTEARYPDQAWEIEVPLRRPRFSDPEDVKRLVADFHEIHKDIFAVSDPEVADRNHWLERNHSLSHRLVARRTYCAKRRGGASLGSPGVFSPFRLDRRRRASLRDADAGLACEGAGHRRIRVHLGGDRSRLIRTEGSERMPRH